MMHLVALAMAARASALAPASVALAARRVSAFAPRGTPVVMWGESRPMSIGDVFDVSSMKSLPSRFATLKEELRRDDFEAVWKDLKRSLASASREIRARGSAAVPCIDAAALVEDRFPDDVADVIRRAGCCIVRGSVGVAEASRWRDACESYVASERMVGFPADGPNVYEAYWSPAQLAMRQHAGVIRTQTALNRLWRATPGEDGQVAVDLHRPISYGERLRLRTPGDGGFSLVPHMDGGGCERWEDPGYRRVYESILRGDWRTYDAYDASRRLDAVTDLYDTPNTCTSFRTFQGWLSLSHVDEGDSGLRLLPRIRESTAYVMLRPFAAGAEPSDFCGAFPGKSQLVEAHHHAPLHDCLVTLPALAPGDTVWWHCDGVHAVDVPIASRSSVLYNPAAPLCATNSDYLRRQRDHFERGAAPPDFPQNDCDAYAKNRGTPADLDARGRRVLGFDAYPAAPVPGESRSDFLQSAKLRAAHATRCAS